MNSLRLPHPSFSPMCLLTLTLAILLYKLPAPVSANYEHYCDSGTFNNQRNGQCGESLANTILSLCRALSETFMGKYIMKRIPAKGQVEKRLSDISLTRANAFSFMSKRHAEQNIVCECCVHRCSFTEMYQYCQLPPLSFKKRTSGGDSSLRKRQHGQSSKLEDSFPWAKSRTKK